MKNVKIQGNVTLFNMLVEQLNTSITALRPIVIDNVNSFSEDMLMDSFASIEKVFDSINAFNNMAKCRAFEIVPDVVFEASADKE